MEVAYERDIFHHRRGRRCRYRLEQDWRTFARLLGQAYADELHVPLLQRMLTPDEREAPEARIRIIQTLLAGDVISQRELKKRAWNRNAG